MVFGVIIYVDSYLYTTQNFARPYMWGWGVPGL